MDIFKQLLLIRKIYLLISLFTINDKTKQRYWVGEILDVEPVFNKEAKTILSEYKKKGWYAEMQEQLKDYIEKYLVDLPLISDIDLKISENLMF